MLKWVKDTTVQSQSVCTVHVYTQPWAQHSLEQRRNIGMSVNVAWLPDYGQAILWPAILWLMSITVRTKDHRRASSPQTGY